MTALERFNSSLRDGNLESRDLPSITIQLDHSRDTSGFFQQPGCQDVMAVVRRSTSADSLNTNFAAHRTRPGTNHLDTHSSSDPSTGTTVQQSNLTINADTIESLVSALEI